MLILASGSPRRVALLSGIVSDFLVVPSCFDERQSDDLSPQDYAVRCALGKASQVFENQKAAHGKDMVVLGADTVVVCGDCVLGKPKSAESAKQMLRQISGAWHSVITAVCVISSAGSSVDFDKTDLYIDRLTDDEIDRYVAGGSPLDKAGAYGLQDDLISGKLLHIKGNRDNVIGLPLKLCTLLLTEAKVLCKDLSEITT